MPIEPRKWLAKSKSLTKVRDMPAEMVAQVRRFNRTVTQRIGALNENFLASHRPLGQNRLLWEIGANGCDVRTLLLGLEDRGRAYGVRLMRLETKDELGEAVQMYRTSGYIEVEPFNDEPYADHWFEKALDSV
jgi:hypothetical protein